MRSVSSIMDALDALTPGKVDLDEPGIAAMTELYSLIGPELPKDMETTPIDSPVPDAEVLTFSLDEGHAGRVSVPATPGGSVNFQWLSEQSPFASFVLNNFSFRDVQDKDREYNGDEELVFFVPGLNTLHQPSPGETSTMERVVYYTKVLQSIPMVQIHTGTSFDQGDIEIDISDSPILRDYLMNSGDQLAYNIRPEYDENTLKYNARKIDTLQIALSQSNSVDTPVKKSIRTLLMTTSDSEAKPFVLVVYSRGAVECEAALRQYIKESEINESSDEIEARLRERITVLTVGSLSHNYPDGPAYLHMAAWSDPVSNSSGVTSKNNVSGAGKDSVFLNFTSPYNPDAFDNHNFGAVSSQYLSVMLSFNKATGLRDLWEKGNNGEITEPDNIDELLRAMIEVTKGYEWLWRKDAALKDLDVDAFPAFGAAKALLSHDLGADFLDRLEANFP